MEAVEKINFFCTRYFSVMDKTVCQTRCLNLDSRVPRDTVHLSYRGSLRHAVER